MPSSSAQFKRWMKETGVTRTYWEIDLMRGAFLAGHAAGRRSVRPAKRRGKGKQR